MYEIKWSFLKFCKYLNVYSVFICEFVVVFDFDRDSLISIKSSNFYISSVGHEKVTEKVNRANTG